MQRDVCTAYCQQHGHEIVSVWLDDAISGAEEDRPILWQAIASLKRGMVLVVYRSDRLARNLYLHELIYREVAKRKATIEVVDGSRNGDSPEDELVRGIMAVFAAYERKVIAARTKAASLRHQANGFAVSKDPPYGKQAGEPVESAGRMRRTWIDDPFEQKVIREIVRMRAENGSSFREIARVLNQTGVRCRGENWNHKLIGRILGRNGKKADASGKTVAQDRV
jgi:DNA invertase Pin-like site-specific DNA recombinase